MGVTLRSWAGPFVHQGDATDRGARRFGLGHVAAVRGDHEQVQGNTDGGDEPRA